MSIIAGPGRHQNMLLARDDFAVEAAMTRLRGGIQAAVDLVWDAFHHDRHVHESTLQTNTEPQWCDRKTAGGKVLQPVPRGFAEAHSGQRRS